MQSPEDYLLQPGDAVEFVYPWGRKGGGQDNPPIRCPFPYYGGKRRPAPEIWRRFGDVKNYVEPFFGGGAVLLNRPRWSPSKLEIVNDMDALLTNFWRSVKLHPLKLARAADYPISEVDLHARMTWQRNHREEITERLRSQEAWCDPMVAAWWVWGISQHIGDDYPSTARSRPSVSKGGIHRRIYDISRGDRLRQEFELLASRLEHVRILCGDWTRAVTHSLTDIYGLTGILLDPPYTAESTRRKRNLYAMDDLAVGHQVQTWAVENGDNPLLRIALCGYEGEYEMPPSWTKFCWKGSSKKGHLERIWFSPHCLKGTPE